MGVGLAGELVYESVNLSCTHWVCGQVVEAMVELGKKVVEPEEGQGEPVKPTSAEGGKKGGKKELAKAAEGATGMWGGPLVPYRCTPSYTLFSVGNLQFVPVRKRCEFAAFAEAALGSGQAPRRRPTFWRRGSLLLAFRSRLHPTQVLD